jgi:hypothetical protein
MQIGVVITTSSRYDDNKIREIRRTESRVADSIDPCKCKRAGIAA